MIKKFNNYCCVQGKDSIMKSVRWNEDSGWDDELLKRMLLKAVIEREWKEVYIASSAFEHNCVWFNSNFRNNKWKQTGINFLECLVLENKFQ